MIPGRKTFIDQSMFDIQCKNKGRSICQIVQNNDLPNIECNKLYKIVASQVQKQLKTQGLRKLGNIRKISKSGEV